MWVLGFISVCMGGGGSYLPWEFNPHYFLNRRLIWPAFLAARDSTLLSSVPHGVKEVLGAKPIRTHHTYLRGCCPERGKSTHPPQACWHHPKRRLFGSDLPSSGGPNLLSSILQWERSAPQSWDILSVSPPEAIVWD